MGKSRAATALARKRWAGTDKAYRTAHARMMAARRWALYRAELALRAAREPEFKPEPQS